MTEGNLVASEEVSDDRPAFDTSVSHHARVYDYLLGGKDHYAADRAYAEALEAVYPGMAVAARANRAFLGRVVRFLAGEAELSQFLDVGTGIPSAGSTHEVAQEVRPDSRIVYVDYDPVVLSHARALLVGHEPGTTSYIDADLRDPEFILEQAALTLDLTQPVGLLLVAILPAIGDHEEPHRIVASLVDALPSGSYLAISHGVVDEDNSAETAKAQDITREMSRQQFTARSQADVARFFDGLDLIEPRLTRIEDWRPRPQDRIESRTSIWGGVARKA